MNLSREQFDNIKPLHHVIIQVEELHREKHGIVFSGDTGEARKEFATHKGIVHRHPLKRGSNPSGVLHKFEYELEIGDTVYFAWDAFRMYQRMEKKEFDEDAEHMHYVVDGQHYILIAFAELMLIERDGDRWGINGWIGGRHPKKKRHASGIQLLGPNYELELLKVISGDIRELDPDDDDKERLIVEYPPRRMPVYDIGEHVSETKVQVNNVVCFPEGFAVPLSYKFIDGFDLKAVNVMQVAAYDEDYSESKDS